MGRKRMVLEGKVFGRLAVLSYVVRKSKDHSYFLCQCDCGVGIEVRGSHLTMGSVRSCGCLGKDVSSENLSRYVNNEDYKGKGNPAYKHGMTKTRIYRIYQGAKQRCEDPSTGPYPRYGGRGILFKWSDFMSFYKDMGQEYEKHTQAFGESDTSLDRIDGNGNYTKENCRWTTKRGQSRNTSSNKRVTFKGVTLCCVEWDEKLGLPRATVQTRLRNGWTVTRALTKPVKKMRYNR